MNEARSKARDARRITEIRQIEQAINRYHLDNGSYPTHSHTHTNCAWQNTSSWSHTMNQLVPTYLSQVPVDPINANGFCYAYLSEFTNHSNIECGGLSRQNYKWSLLFKLENPNTTFDRVTIVNNNNALTQATHCIHGPRI